MFPAVAVTLGISLLPPLDRYVRFWELNHPALSKPPEMRGMGPLTKEELQAVRDRIEDQLRRARNRFDKEGADLERRGADAETLRKTKEEHDKALESIRRLSNQLEKLERNK